MDIIDFRIYIFSFLYVKKIVIKVILIIFNVYFVNFLYIIYNMY